MNKKGFTLIELLAIIVILAIIAVITVPIILNIIEESKKGAAKDSAYGYKDSINKYYTQQLLNNQNLKLNDTYTVTNGTLSGGDFGDSNVTSFPIQISGTVPSSGSLTYSNNNLTEGCLVVGEYAVTFEDGNVKGVEKGECQISLTMEEMCPGCKFIFITDTSSRYGIVGSAYDAYSNMPTAQAGLTDDYTTLIGPGGHQYFLGLIESTTTPGKIGRAFVCGVEDGKPFCLEGYDATKWSDDANIGILNTIFPECGVDVSDSDASCNGSSVSAYTYGHSRIHVDDLNNNGCVVYNTGVVYCYAW